MEVKSLTDKLSEGSELKGSIGGEVRQEKGSLLSLSGPFDNCVLQELGFGLVWWFQW